MDKPLTGANKKTRIHNDPGFLIPN